jgi:site-specific DNA-methyltransferase (adenine-specific)
MTDVINEVRKSKIICELYNDHFQNSKYWNIPKAQLLIADIPYNVGKNAYGSSPSWYIDGDNKNGESKLANTDFFDSDYDFSVQDFLYFCNRIVKPEPKNRNEAACMIVFCEYEQQFYLIQEAKKYGFMNYINLVFRKNFSPQVLKANMRIVGNCEYAVVLYREKLPKFRNQGKMIFNCFDFHKDSEYDKIHPTQKPVSLIRQLIEIFTDEGDTVIDPTAGSGSSLIAAMQLKRRSYGFEIKKDTFKQAIKWIEDEKKIMNNEYYLPERDNGLFRGVQ